MDQITRVVQQIGNGGHVYLPKCMVGQKVALTLVEKGIEDIEKDALGILKPYFRHIMGVYLYGSYARGEQTPQSDIDILAITDGKVKIGERINEYVILSISPEQIEKSIEYTAPLILPILKEAKPILNSGLIERYGKERLTKKNTRWYIETTETSLNLVREWIKDEDIQSIPHIVYPLLLRLRGLYMIECLINIKKYSHKGVIELLMSGGMSYNQIDQINRIYRENRDNKKISPNNLTYRDISGLYDIVSRYYKKVRGLWERLK